MVKKKYKHIIHNKLKTNNYYNHLFTFYLFISVISSLTLIFLDDGFNLYLFILKIIIIFFLLMFISVILEFKYRGDYISPYTFYNLEIFFNSFIDNIHNQNNFNSFFNKYDAISKKKIKQIFVNNKRNFFLSSIRKNNDIYELIFIDEMKMLEFFIFKFLVMHGVHKMEVKKIKNNFKIIRII